MVNFKLTRTLDTPHMFFLPAELKGRVIQELQKQNIPYQSFSWRQYQPSDHEQDLALAKLNFQKAQWTGDLNRMGAIYSIVAPEDLFDSWRQYQPSDHEQDLALAKLNFQKAQWTGDLNRMGAIYSIVAPEDLFDVCLQLFGITMDNDERQLQSVYDRKAEETYLRDYQDMDGIIPVHQPISHQS